AQPETSSILFTPREKEVLDLMIQGYTNQDIAEHLFISAHTVKNHLTKIYMKLGVGDRAGAMLKMLRPDSS
ncbi:helix-turn-helix transcriptional regulator, partial [Cohnella xylanilytica]